MSGNKVLRTGEGWRMVRVPSRLAGRAARHARRTRQSLAEVVRRALAEHLDREGAK